jgi:hypothetical protein
MKGRIILCKFILVNILISCDPGKTRCPDQELNDLVLKIESAVFRGEFSSFYEAFNMSAFEAKCLRHLRGREINVNSWTFENRFQSEAISGLRGFFIEIAENVGRGGCFKLSKIYIEKGRHHLIFSIYGSVGVKFIDFEVDNAGEMIVDYFDYYVGEEYSVSFSNHIFFDLSPNSEEYQLAVEAVRVAGRLARQGDYLAAFEKVNGVPKRFDVKMLQKMKVGIARHISETLYEKCLTEFIASDTLEGRFQTYQSMNLYFSQGINDKAFSEINDLKAIVGDGPLISLLEGEYYYGVNDFQSAIWRCDLSIQECPTLYSAYVLKANALYSMGDVEGADKFLSHMQTFFNLSDSEMLKIEKNETR